MNMIKLFLVPKKQQQFLSSRASRIYRAVGTGDAGGAIPPGVKAKSRSSNGFGLLLVISRYVSRVVK